MSTNTLSMVWQLDVPGTQIVTLAYGLLKLGLEPVPADTVMGSWFEAEGVTGGGGGGGGVCCGGVAPFMLHAAVAKVRVNRESNKAIRRNLRARGALWLSDAAVRIE